MTTAASGPGGYWLVYEISLGLCTNLNCLNYDLSLRTFLPPSLPSLPSSPNSLSSSLLHSNTAFRPVDSMQGQIQHVYTGETAELQCVIQPGRAKELYSVKWHRYNQRGDFVFPPLTAAILPDGPHRYISPSNFSLFVAIENISQNGTACQCSVAIAGCSPASYPGCSSTPRFSDGPRITLIVEGGSSACSTVVLS